MPALFRPPLMFIWMIGTVTTCVLALFLCARSTAAYSALIVTLDYPAALVTGSSSAGFSDNVGVNSAKKPHWNERLPVAFVFWYQPDSSDPKVWGSWPCACIFS
jgi:hypothetical protein